MNHIRVQARRLKVSQSAWLIANIMGVAVFLALASRSWIEPKLKDVPGANGGAFIFWGLTALPVFAAFMLANLLWAGLGVAEGLRCRQWIGCMLALVAIGVWVAAFIFDGLHHGT